MGECYNCGCYAQTEKHHVFHGTANRRICDRYPLLKFDLCPECHRGTNGVHGKDGHELNLKFKKTAQILFETHYGTREEFIKLFGRNYLE
jgi:hypothetical protein